MLHRDKFCFPESSIQSLLNAIKDNGICINRLDTEITLPDPKDLVFYEVMMAKRQDEAMLVTGNIKHFPKEPFIVTPNEFLAMIE